MNTEATTLYKLMVLYMLSKVNFPLSNSQIADFMLDKQYTTYFTLQEVLSSLADDGFVNVLTYRSSTQYRLTSSGKDTISFFSNKTSNAIREEIDVYLTGVGQRRRPTATGAGRIARIPMPRRAGTCQRAGGRRRNPFERPA